jgi:hypothetical protein
VPLDPDATLAAGLPQGVRQPVVAVPVANPRRCFAVILYSGHESGTDLNQQERRLLNRLARHAEIAYAYLESEMLRARVAALERQLDQIQVA